MLDYLNIFVIYHKTGTMATHVSFYSQLSSDQIVLCLPGHKKGYKADTSVCLYIK